MVDHQFHSGYYCKNAKSFRAAYGDLSILRSLCKEGTPVLALTGTADNHTREVIMCDLVINSDVLEVFLSPNRTNLRINVIKTTKKDALSNLDWLVELCHRKQSETPKTILFCHTMKDVATVTNYLMLKLGSSAYSPPTSRESEDCLIGIYHSMSWDNYNYKDRIVSQLKSNWKVRLVVATTALSMGVNFPGIRYIINWGPARNLLDHHQEAGRAGRDDKKPQILWLFTMDNSKLTVRTK
ncbi:Hypothetical predicted protein [Paramuricea clavata]|uniref:DNA 3'-5' helicase n=1 Tax=Paramuricea clavata TaxID=317549 RepID=A0A6S7GKN0_PARCT|nr:Hypothetical predicted protein [Paramuricea clavata]